MVTVADCERVQTDWYVARALNVGGSVWNDSGLLWTDGPDGINLMFPASLSSAALDRGIARANDLGRDLIGAWLSRDTDARPLEQAGFRRGWSPWWMTASLMDVPVVLDPRVSLEEDGLDDEGEQSAFRDELALARVRPRVAWCAAARTLRTARFAGHAWSFLDGDLTGIFAMNVWPRFQRTGLGTALLSAVCTAARSAGANQAVLNATPEGKLLYSTCGFTQIGEGITWWRHRDTVTVGR